MTGPLNSALLPETALALLLETACGEFEALQAISLGKLQLVPEAYESTPSSDNIRLASATIRMALAKSFLFTANRANRVCQKNKAKLSVDRNCRENFLRATKPLADVRDVNEHGFDGDERSEKNKPSLHEQRGGWVDETSLVIEGPDKIFMGPLNLFEIYTAVAQMRSVAGFIALARIQP